VSQQSTLGADSGISTASLFDGDCVQARWADEGIVELCFDRRGLAINKLDQPTIDQFGQALVAIAAAGPAVRGVLVTSGKDVFIVGADIVEFTERFKRPEAEISASFLESNRIFMAFEDLELPTVAAINGFALGGGLELALTASLRVMSDAAEVGFPEVKLGLFPGLGGTVRLPRLAGAETAIQWIAGGKPAKAEAALAAGVVDAVCAAGELRDTALAWLRRAIAGEIDWRARQARKRAPLPRELGELRALFAKAKAETAAASAPHQPAALAAVELMAHSVMLDRDSAQPLECEAFARIAKTQAADSLVRTFLSEQALKKLGRAHAAQAQPVRRVAVLGAGIMGGGIAYANALRGTPVRMKDIAEPALRLGMGEAAKQLAKQVKQGRRSQEQADAVLASITPQLDYQGFGDCDLVIEAIVENIDVKRRVLAELERELRDDAIIASNTSSLRIDDMAASLRQPQRFVGMHFFNPVPLMPLVEVVKGSHSSEQAVSTAVRHALAMGKTPIVVRDCPGFLVNRILTAYMRGFIRLVTDGADFVRVDQVMEAFGWPMGPAYLEDVIGLDTGSHVNDVISAGYPEHMPELKLDALRLLASRGRYGQKNGIGFYRYQSDASGKPKRYLAEDTHALLAEVQPQGRRTFSDQEIVERMMLPLIIEAARALEAGVVGSPAELDMALLLGLGFPAYLGGALKYADWLGLREVVRASVRYQHLGPEYQATERMREMAANEQRYYAD